MFRARACSLNCWVSLWRLNGKLKRIWFQFMYFSCTSVIRPWHTFWQCIVHFHALLRTRLHSSILETPYGMWEGCLGFHVFVFLDFSWGTANKQKNPPYCSCCAKSPVLHSKEAYSVLRVLRVCKGLDAILALVHTVFWYAFSSGMYGMTKV